MKKEFRNFEESCKITRDLQFGTFNDWEKYCKSGNKPDDIPSNPDTVYKNKWRGWGYWLGTEYLPFYEAREYACDLSLSGFTTWRIYCKSGKPYDIPSNPQKKYKKDWISLGDFLGTNTIATAKRKYRSFNESRKFVRKLKLKNGKEWKEYCESGNKPDDIPSSPMTTYKNKGWVSLGDFLGTFFVANYNRQYRTFNEAKKFVRGLNLKSQKEWEEYCKSGNKPDDISTHPQTLYKNKGWKGLGDWIGTGRISEQERSKNFLSFSDARKIVHELAKKHNIQTNQDWNDAIKKGLIPDNIPASPRTVYTKKRKK